MMIWTESGTMMGLVERSDEYHASTRRRPTMTLFDY